MNYNIEGEPLPVVICNLEANETMITEKGAMSWMLVALVGLFHFQLKVMYVLAASALIGLICFNFLSM